MRLAASSFEIPDGLLAIRAAAQLNPKPRQGLSSKNPASHPALDDANSTVAIGLRAGLVLNGLRQSERARYYSGAQGRYTSPDWSDEPEPVPYADFKDPQTLNLYTYGSNNPLKNRDLDGHCTVDGEEHNWLWCVAHTIGFTQTVKEQADAARQALSQMQGFTINGQTPTEIANNGTNQQVISANRAATQFLLGVATQALAPVQPTSRVESRRSVR